MKIKFTPLIYTLVFICFCGAANAQSLADSLRINVGASVATVNGIFGTNVNTASGAEAQTPYNTGTGVALTLDIPVIPHINISASAGYNIFFKTSDASSSLQAISGAPLQNFQTIPLKLGVKWFIGKSFYIHGEMGETLFANKKALYGIYSNSLTYSPGLGFLIKLKNHSFIDAGLRFEGFQSFYNDGVMNHFFAFHVAYGLKL